MAIKWDRWIKRDSGSLFFAGFGFLFSTIVFLYPYFSKPKIKTKEDLAFISGPFETYNWVALGGRNGSSLTFKLQNYRNWFKIEADFFSILHKDELKQIPQGERLLIGIPKNDTVFLNTNKNPFFVYAISSEKTTFIDANEAIVVHNSPLLLFAAGTTAVIGAILIYFGRKAKVRTPIW